MYSSAGLHTLSSSDTAVSEAKADSASVSSGPTKFETVNWPIANVAPEAFEHDGVTAPSTRSEKLGKLLVMKLLYANDDAEDDGEQNRQEELFVQYEREPG